MISRLRRWIGAFLAGLLVALGFNVYGDAQVTVTWDDPTTNEDGTPLTDLANIKIYRAGSDTLIATVGPGVETFSEMRPDGEWCYYATAVDDDGNESVPSNTECKTIDTLLPGSPGNLRVD